MARLVQTTTKIFENLQGYAPDRTSATKNADRTEPTGKITGPDRANLVLHGTGSDQGIWCWPGARCGVRCVSFCILCGLSPPVTTGQTTFDRANKNQQQPDRQKDVPDRTGRRTKAPDRTGPGPGPLALVRCVSLLNY